MQEKIRTSRRKFIQGAAAAGVSAAGFGILGCNRNKSANRAIKIGFVSPRTGVLAAFGEGTDYVLSQVRAKIAGGISTHTGTRAVEIIERDTQSDPNRAAEVATSLIQSDKVDLMLSASTADTVNPVSDQCEINGVPCLTTDCPWQAYYFGRGGKPGGGFDWTYHFFWGLEDLIAVYTNMWGSIPTNKIVGALWPNDAEGNAFSDPTTGFPSALQSKGFRLIDSGRFQPTTNDFSAQIAAFKNAGAEIVTGVLPPSAFAIFWSQAAQQNFRPKAVTVAKSLLFPAAVEAIGDRAKGLTTEVWWSPRHSFKSGLTGESAAEFCAAYEKATGKQWTQPIGFRHALLEAALDVLGRAANLDSPAAIRDAIRATNYQAIVGRIAWDGNPVRNVCRTPLVGGQWAAGGKFKYSLLIVNNETAPAIPADRKLVTL